VSSTLACPSCSLISRLPAAAEGASFQCPRCLGRLRARKPRSLERATALLSAAAILYVPANYFPVMTITILGKTEADTILTGVDELFAAGMWEIGLLIFFASITVPLLKIVGLTYLLVSVRRRSSWSPERRTLMYRIIEYVGRWSMIDMFMLSILVALVQLGALATIDPGIGATCFAAVVVITMFAASSFDPRIIWDEKGNDHG
jgi:paraquat-inducible protein A